MTVIRPNSISGITSITTFQNSIEFYKSDGSAGANIDNISVNTAGILTAANFKTGSSNLHSTGLTVGNNFLHTTGINVGTGATIHVPSSNVLTLGTNSNERLRIASNGHVAIGTDSPNSALPLTIAGQYPGIQFKDNQGTTDFNINADSSAFRIQTGTAGAGPSEKLRIGNSGQIGLSGANYGSSGQVLTSQGSGSAATWSTISGTTINNNADNRLISGSNTANTLNGETNWYVSGSSLALGTTSPAANFHMRNSYVSMRIDSDGSNNDTKFYNVTGTGKNNYIYFGDASDDDVGQIAYDHNGDHMKFIVGASERMRLNSNGLQFGGSNGANHALDDYEEGSYTADFEVTSGSANFVNNTLHYVKIGSMCYVHGEIGTNSASSAGGDLRFDLPFTAKASGSNMDGHARGICGAIWNYYGSSNPYGNYGWYPLHIQLNSGNANNIILYIVGYNSQNSNWGPIGNLIGSSAQIGISFTYRTN